MFASGDQFLHVDYVPIFALGLKGLGTNQSLADH